MIRIVFILFLTCACLQPFEGQAQVNIITTIANQDTIRGFGGDNAPAIDAKLNRPESLCVDKYNNIYIADAVNNRIRKINTSTGIITTVAGCSDTIGFAGDSGLAINAKLNSPEGIFTDSIGDIYFTDAGNGRVRKVTISTGIITTVAGIDSAGYNGDGILAINAELNAPSGLCLDKSGNIYIADYQNQRVRKVDVASGIISTVAGTGIIGYTGDNG